MNVHVAEWEAGHIKVALDKHIKELKKLAADCRTHGATTAHRQLLDEVGHLESTTLKNFDVQLDLLVAAAEGTDSAQRTLPEGKRKRGPRGPRKRGKKTDAEPGAPPEVGG